MFSDITLRVILHDITYWLTFKILRVDPNKQFNENNPKEMKTAKRCAAIYKVIYAKICILIFFGSALIYNLAASLATNLIK